MRLYLAALLAPLVLSACGGDDETTNGREVLDTLNEVADAAPACSDVWVVGQTLPEDYEGCMDEDGTFLVATTLECKDDTQLVSLEDEYLWVVTPGEIQQSPGEIAEDAEGYGAAYEKCLNG